MQQIYPTVLNRARVIGAAGALTADQIATFQDLYNTTLADQRTAAAGAPAVPGTGTDALIGQATPGDWDTYNTLNTAYIKAVARNTARQQPAYMQWQATQDGGTRAPLTTTGGSSTGGSSSTPRSGTIAATTPPVVGVSTTGLTWSNPYVKWGAIGATALAAGALVIMAAKKHKRRR